MALTPKDKRAQVIKRPGIERDAKAQIIAFDVDPKAGAADVKSAVEELFKVKVEDVRLFNVRGKTKPINRWIGKRRDWRKAYVRLKEGEKAPDFIEGPEGERTLVKPLETPKFLKFISYVPEDVLDLVQVIEVGLPVSALELFQAESTLPLPRVLKLVRIPERTYARRRVSGRLSAEESDRLVRVGRLFSAATGLFGGDVAATVDWLSKPLAALHRAIPLDVAETEAGSHEVERVIQQLEYGVFP